MSGYRPEGIEDAFVENGSAPLPALGVVGWIRWTWRQLTSMRVALLLLMLLAVAAVPGSALPQRPQNPAAVEEYLADHATAGPWLDRMGMFDVYASVWFSAIYILLFVSLVGCITPRVRAHWRALRAKPPRTPRRFERFPARAERVVAASPADVADAAAAHLRGPRWLPRFRVEQSTEPAPAGALDGVAHTVSAERGYLRETGNLLFHLALLGLLVSVGVGQALEYRGQAIVVQGRGFANSVSAYDTFFSGTAFDPESLHPFSITLDDFDAEFTEDASLAAKDFTAHVTVRDDEQAPRPETIKVNHPLEIGGAKVYLQGNGFAPDVEVVDADGNVAFSGPVPFIPEDAVYTSRGVIKVPDVTSGDQIGLVGYLLPTAQMTEGGLRSIHPDLRNPVLVLTVWRGDLGLDSGIPQNVYELDTDAMIQVNDGEEPATLLLSPGQSVDLPDGLGRITFRGGLPDDPTQTATGVPRFVALDLRHDPALTWIATFAVASLAGLMLSLFTPRRRVWLRTWTERVDGEPRTVVSAAGLARTDDAGLPGEVDAMLDAASAAIPPPGATTNDSEGADR